MYLISMVLLSVIYGVGAFALEGWLPSVISGGDVPLVSTLVDESLNSSYVMSHWIFQALLLKTTLTLPIMVHSTVEDEGGTRESMKLR